MARPTQTHTPNTPGFGPDQGRTAPALRVVAPLAVNAAPSGAELLANSLGVALDAAAPIMLDKIKTKAADSTALGRADAAIGKTDTKRQAEDKSYAYGVKRALVDRAIVDFKSRAREFYTNEFDKSMGTETLAAELDGIAKGMLQNYSGDPDAARWMTPEVMNTVEQLTGAHDQELANQFKQDRVATVGALMRDAIANQQGIDPEDMKSRMADVLGRGEATKAYAEIVGTMAVENGNPDMIDALIPEKWADGTPGPRSIPEISQYLNQQRYYAQAAADERAGEATAAAKRDAEAIMLRADLDSMMGVPPMVALLDARAAGLPIGASDFRAAVNFFEGTQDRNEDRGVDAGALAEMRIRIAEGPISGDEMRAFIRQNGSANPGVRDELSRLMDDWASANSVHKSDKSPQFMSDYKSILTSKYGVPSWETSETKARYASGLKMYLDEIEAGKSAKDAFAAADAFLASGGQAKPSAGPAPADVVADVKRFAAGKLSKTDFRNAYPGADAALFIREQNRKGLLTTAETRAALEALLDQPQ